jgi:hypothetical protein
MVFVNCPGCRKPFESGRSLSSHQRRCAGLKAKAKMRLSKQLENGKRKVQANISRQSEMSKSTLTQMREEVRERINSLEPGDIITNNMKRKLSDSHVSYS